MTDSSTEVQEPFCLTDFSGILHSYFMVHSFSALCQSPARGSKNPHPDLSPHHHITDVSQVLFGFATDDERRMFTLLLGVSGVGLKIARTLVRVADEGKKQKLMEERDELSARLTLSKCLIRGGH